MKDEEREAEDWVVKIRMENVCMTASEGEMDWKEQREKTELHTINSACRGEVAMETHPFTSHILRFPW